MGGYSASGGAHKGKLEIGLWVAEVDLKWLSRALGGCGGFELVGDGLTLL